MKKYFVMIFLMSIIGCSQNEEKDEEIIELKINLIEEVRAFQG